MLNDEHIEYSSVDKYWARQALQHLALDGNYKFKSIKYRALYLNSLIEENGEARVLLNYHDSSFILKAILAFISHIQSLGLDRMGVNQEALDNLDKVKCELNSILEFTNV